MNIADLKEYMVEAHQNIEDKIERVYNQALKTNGRVDDLEKEQIERKAQLRIIKYAMVTILTVVTGVSVVMVAAYFSNKLGI